MGKRSESKKGTKTSGVATGSDLLKALGHPLRVKILEVLNERKASPVELAADLKEGLSQISYHVQVLKGFNCVELVDTAPRRGALQHYYKAKQEIFIPNSLVAKLPQSARYALINSDLKVIDDDLAASLEQETFYGRCPIARRIQADLDGRGRKEVDDLVGDFTNRYTKIGAESKARKRNGESEGESKLASTVVLVFDSAHSKESKKPERKR